MMSNILEKTLGSIFNPSDSYSGLQGLFKQCIAVKTKQEEAQVIDHYLNILKERLREPGIRPNFIGHCLAFAIFSEFLGYRADFCYIHAINLAQQSTLPDKKMGYAASCCLLREDHELSLLLVNTLVRDLASSNVAVLGLALCALCSAPLPADAIPTLLPAVRDRLTHGTAYVRCRAVIAVHHFLRRYPDQCCHIVTNLIARLGDEDPHVVARVLAILPDIIQASPESVSGIIQPLVAIQRQILAGRLPPDMVYHGLQAPWAQLNIIKCLPELTLTEEDENAAKEVLLETLTHATVKDGNFVPTIRAALISQTLVALLSLEGASDVGQNRAMLHIGTMLKCTSSDVKHEGLQLLELILAKHQIPLSTDQQAVVRASLEHPDSSIQRRALALLTAGAGELDVQSVCGQLFRHAASSEPHLKQWLLEQALSLIGRFPTAVTPDWHLSALVKLLPLADEPQLNQTIFKSAQEILIKGNLQDETRCKLLEVLGQHGEAKKAPTCLLKLYIWTLGQFPTLDPQGTQGAVDKLITLGTKILRNFKENSSDLLMCITLACSKAIETSGYQPSNDLSSFLSQVGEISHDLKEASDEVLHTLPHLDRLHRCISKSSYMPTLDCTLSCMDVFVKQRLKSGTCKAYQPQIAAQILIPRVRSPDVSLAPLLVLPVSTSTNAINTSQISNPNSQPSDDSWSNRSISSPVEATNPLSPMSPDVSTTFVWTKQGRAGSPQPVPSSVQPLAEAFNVSTHVATVTTMVPEDPLGDLLR